MPDEEPETGSNPAPTKTSPPSSEPEGQSVDKLQAEVEKWRSAARKYQDHAKANAEAAAELDKLHKQSMTDQERAVAEARAAARAETLAELGAERARDAIRVAAAGRPVDIDALVEGVDASRFLDDTGSPNRDAIAEWVDRVAPAGRGGQAPDLGQGPRGAPDHALNGDPLLRDLKSKLGVR